MNKSVKSTTYRCQEFSCLVYSSLIYKDIQSPIRRSRNKVEYHSQGPLDGKPLKFSRDLESDWTVKKDKPHYGLKEHASVDINHGFILATTITPASVNDTNYLPYCTVYSRHAEQPIEKVFADKGYAGKPNRDFLVLNEIADGIMRKDSTTAKLIMKKIVIKRYQKFDISLSNILALVICLMVLKERGSRRL